MASTPVARKHTREEDKASDAPTRQARVDNDGGSSGSPAQPCKRARVQSPLSLFDDLADDLLKHIMVNIDCAASLARAARTCKAWRHRAPHAAVEMARLKGLRLAPQTLRRLHTLLLNLKRSAVSVKALTSPKKADRSQAVQELQSLGDQEVLSVHVATIVGLLEDESRSVRYYALSCLAGRLPAAPDVGLFAPDVLRPHITTLVQSLPISLVNDQRSAEKTIQALYGQDAATLAPHMTSILGTLMYGSMCCTTLGLLMELDVATVAQHTEVILKCLQDGDWIKGVTRPSSPVHHALCMVMRVKVVMLVMTLMLVKVDAAHLAPFTDGIVLQLENPDGAVRGSVMRVLDKLDAASLATHTAAIVTVLADSNNLARITAWDIVEHTLEATRVQPHKATIAFYLESNNMPVRQRAARVLKRLH